MTVEGGHWYRRDGSPCYEVPTKTGGVRAVNLRWDRKLNLVPSVTTALQVVAKPALERWKCEKHALAAITLPRIEGETSDQLMRRIAEDAAAQSKAAAEEGTRIHDAIECAFKGQPYPHKYKNHVDAAMQRIGELFPGIHDWVAEEYFAHPLGYGGKTDLHSPSTGIVIDYKGKDGELWQDDAHAYAKAIGKDGEPCDKRCDYDQNIQLAAYQRGLRLRHNVCANLFISRTHPGQIAHKVWSRDDVAYGLEYFDAALALWKIAHRYESSFTITEEEAA